MVSNTNHIKKQPKIIPFKTQLGQFKKELQTPKTNNMFSKSKMWNVFQKHAADPELLQRHDIEKYIIDDKTEKIIRTLMRYFRGDENFNEDKLITSKPSLRKGILLFGDHGVGKSLLFEILESAGNDLYKNHGFRKMRFKSSSCSSLVNTYMREVKIEGSNFNISDYYIRPFYFDDLAYEPKAFNKTELLGEVLYERDRNKAITFITTNKSPKVIAERYGSLIGDRLDSMFNIIKWTGETLRE